MNLARVHYHLPGLFEFYELYRLFLPLFYEKRCWFYPWCDIASVYGAPQGCLWGGGRTSEGTASPRDVLSLLDEYRISPRLTFSNSCLRTGHLSDKKCNDLCALFEKAAGKGGVIVHSELLSDYLQAAYPELYLVSSTTKVLTRFEDLRAELSRPCFRYVVPDFRLNKSFDKLATLSPEMKAKTEFLCNECCDIGCTARKACYENVSLKNLGETVRDHPCASADAKGGYRFSRAMKNPAFISIHDIQHTYLPMGFSNFKIEGRNLGSAMVLEFLLYYLTKPEHQIEVREAVYLDAMLDLF